MNACKPIIISMVFRTVLPAVFKRSIDRLFLKYSKTLRGNCIISIKLPLLLCLQCDSSLIPFLSTWKRAFTFQSVSSIQCKNCIRAFHDLLVVFFLEKLYSLFVYLNRYIRSERSIILINFCLSIISSNILILVGQTQTHNKVWWWIGLNLRLNIDLFGLFVFSLK